MEWRTQEGKAKDSSSEDRPSRGQGQECSRAMTRTQRGSDLKKMVFTPKSRKFSGIFKRSPGKKMCSKFFSQALWRSSRRNKIGHDFGPFSTSQKIPRAEDRTFARLADFEAKAKDIKMHL